ncbi:kinase-like domain-containing protein [Glomus cerebriforme]|uniref:Kinase-like domain-containing protein n=1 Tax=Glomus cerebriforme TaxID=658196 RepID=A0A397SIW6_9GLOM|nr:kinase-like domain-containing protein [Glomus cerebriforme]
MAWICKGCNQKNSYYWCIGCNTKHFQQNFENWTSGNDDIDKLIQDIQLSATSYEKVLEWIPYDRFYDIKYIAKGGFGKIYRANWIDGYIRLWDYENQNWYRMRSNKFVALKSLNSSKNVTLNFINEITLHHKVDYASAIIRLYGITQDPETKNYMMVLHYAYNGSLRNYLDKYYNELDWRDKIHNLYVMAAGIDQIHKKELIHRDLHIGNILHTGHTCITDMGLCKPADYNVLSNTQNNIYGVLPYLGPEILRGQNYTKAADIYSFGIIMYEVMSGLPPYHDVSHDENLTMKICQGLRPRFNIKIPQDIVHLIKRCLDANPLNRPTAERIKETLYLWWVNFNSQTELLKQIQEADEINKTLSSRNIPSTSLSYETHSEAIYTSRLLNYKNLPEPKNSDDYYEQNDNIISEEYSESLQIDISRMKINENTSIH